MAARADMEVTIVTRGARPLTAFDPDLVAMLVERSRAVGADLHTYAEVEAVEKTEHGLRVRASIDSQTRHFEAELMVHGAASANEAAPHRDGHTVEHQGPFPSGLDRGWRAPQTDTAGPEGPAASPLTRDGAPPPRRPPQAALRAWSLAVAAAELSTACTSAT
jgi:hypothetical protein